MVIGFQSPVVPTFNTPFESTSCKAPSALAQTAMDIKVMNKDKNLKSFIEHTPVWFEDPEQHKEYFDES